MSTADRSNRNENDVFWGEIAPCDHLLQIYDDDSVLLDALQGFIGGGLRAGESAIVIATAAHLDALRERFEDSGIDVTAAQSRDQYIPLLAEETLAQFVVGGWPDDDRFDDVVTKLMVRAKKSGRRVRAFGEMVALLWGRGDYAATIRLEHLWNELIHKMGFPLFCAYPRAGITQDVSASIHKICAAHSKVVPGSLAQSVIDI